MHRRTILSYAFGHLAPRCCLAQHGWWLGVAARLQTQGNHKRYKFLCYALLSVSPWETGKCCACGASEPFRNCCKQLAADLKVIPFVTNATPCLQHGTGSFAARGCDCCRRRHCAMQHKHWSTILAPLNISLHAARLPYVLHTCAAPHRPLHCSCCHATKRIHGAVCRASHGCFTGI